MKNKIALGLLCSMVVLGLCGCGTEEKELSIVGTYIQTNYHKSGMIDGELTLYENGSCAWQYWSKSVITGEYTISEAERTYCSYDYTENEVVISYTSYVSDIPIETTCKYDNGIINCGQSGTFEK